jgi:hypothetical protein
MLSCAQQSLSLLRVLLPQWPLQSLAAPQMLWPRQGVLRWPLQQQAVLRLQLRQWALPPSRSPRRVDSSSWPDECASSDGE